MEKVCNEICREIHERIEERIEKPIRERRKKNKKKCKKKKCKKRCLCCNKWKCWTVSFFYWVVEYIIIKIIKWSIRVVCETIKVVVRLVKVVFTLIYSLIQIIVWLYRWIKCVLKGEKGFEDLPFLTLPVEVVIIHRNCEERNPIVEDLNYENLINRWILNADKIFRDRVKIIVTRHGKTKHMCSNEFFIMDSSNWFKKSWKYVKNLALIAGENSPRYLTIYIVKGFKGGKLGLHNPLFGSVFVAYNATETSLAHELGHALLWVNAGHTDVNGYLMATPESKRLSGINWPIESPKITSGERCTMRRSRWLNWTAKDAVVAIITGMVIIILLTPEPQILIPSILCEYVSPFMSKTFDCQVFWQGVEKAILPP